MPHVTRRLAAPKPVASAEVVDLVEAELGECLPLGVVAHLGRRAQVDVPGTIAKRDDLLGSEVAMPTTTAPHSRSRFHGSSGTGKRGSTSSSTGRPVSASAASRAFHHRPHASSPFPQTAGSNRRCRRHLGLQAG